MKEYNSNKRNVASVHINKAKSVMQKSKAMKAGGHITKFSGDAYKSNKGKGDVIKAGKHEPFSYIQLNPRMLNKRHKQQAINSFSKVVSFGKKIDKRDNGMLKGLSVTKKQ
jgi:ribosomal RNA-processing protein 12